MQTPPPHAWALPCASAAITAEHSLDGGPSAFISTSGLRESPQFAPSVYDLLMPGATLVVADEKKRPGARASSTVLQADATP